MHNNDNTVSLPNICNTILLELRSSVPGLDVHYPEVSSATTAINDNPIAKLESLCKKGVPLCQLFNALCPQSPIEYTQRDGSTKNPQACVGHFIVACHGRLGMDHKDLFTVNDLFQNEEQGFAKVKLHVSVLAFYGCWDSCFLISSTSSLFFSFPLPSGHSNTTISFEEIESSQ